MNMRSKAEAASVIEADGTERCGSGERGDVVDHLLGHYAFSFV
jgi:hypothetical protein